MPLNLPCPSCGSHHVVKNGSTHNGKSKHLCRDCGRQFVDNPTKKFVTSQEISLIEKLLLERIPLAGIVRVVGISMTWLQNYVNTKYSQIPRKIKVSEKLKGKLTVEIDELWSFVDYKGNKQWGWLALDRSTREIVGCYVGDRSPCGEGKRLACLHACMMN